MRILVTGGAGYIGSVVSAELLEHGHEVLVYDNLYRGHHDAVPAAATFYHADLRDEGSLQMALRGCDAVIHLAGLSLVGESMVDPAAYYDNNVRAGLTLLDAMRAAGVPRLVFSSTAAVYQASAGPLREEDPLDPQSPYGETKLAFERALRWYGPAHGLRHCSLRYFNAAGATATHGERHRQETHLIPLLLQVAAGQRESLTLFGADYDTPDGTCVRDYIHVADLARAHLLCLEALDSGVCSAAYNVGCSGAGYSVRQVLDAAREVTGSAIPVHIGPRRAGDPARLVANTERIAAELGFHPQHRSLHGIIESAWRFAQRKAP